MEDNLNSPLNSLSSLKSILNSKKLLISLGVVVASGVVGSLYYLFSIFRNEMDLTEDQKMQIEEIKEEIEESNGELNVESAIQLVSLITIISEDIFKKLNRNIQVHEKRRSALIRSANEEYLQLCKDTFDLKEKALKEATRKLLYQFGNISFEKIQKVLRKIPTYEMETITYKYNHPAFEENSPPDKNTVKEAFIFYSKRFIEEMKNFKKENSNSINELIQREPSLIFKVLVIKIRIDDELFLKFKYSEDQIRYLLYEYNLFEDTEVRKLHDDTNMHNILENDSRSIDNLITS